MIRIAGYDVFLVVDFNRTKRPFIGRVAWKLTNLAKPISRFKVHVNTQKSARSQRTPYHVCWPVSSRPNSPTESTHYGIPPYLPLDGTRYSKNQQAVNTQFISRKICEHGFVREGYTHLGAYRHPHPPSSTGDSARAWVMIYRRVIGMDD